MLRELYAQTPARLFLCNWFTVAKDVYDKIFAALDTALAQLANARYASESVTGSGTHGSNRQGPETLSVLTSLAEVRSAVNEIAATAQRLISIYTPDLEPDLYDQTAFLEVIIDRDAGVYPMVGPGQSYEEMITGEFIASRHKVDIKTPGPSEMF